MKAVTFGWTRWGLCTVQYSGSQKLEEAHRSPCECLHMDYNHRSKRESERGRNWENGGQNLKKKSDRKLNLWSLTWRTVLMPFRELFLSEVKRWYTLRFVTYISQSEAVSIAFKTFRGHMTNLYLSTAPDSNRQFVIPKQMTSFENITKRCWQNSIHSTNQATSYLGCPTLRKKGPVGLGSILCHVMWNWLWESSLG